MSFGRTVRDVLALAAPMVAVQVGLMAMGVVDTVMVGRVSAANLAAVALGTLYFFFVSIFGMGVLMVLDPIVSQAVGARDEAGIARGVQRGLVLAAALSVVGALLLWPAGAVLTRLRQPPDVVPIAAAYVRTLIPGLLPFFLFFVLRQSLQAMGHVAPLVAAIVLANGVNAVLDWALIFGHLGAPAMGAVGAGWATSITRLLMTLGLLVGSWRWMRPYLEEFRDDVLQRGPVLRMLRVGAPIGVQHQLEFGAFGATALLMGTLGTVPMAAHQVAINLASLTFMVPLGIGGAAAVLVGRAVGRGDEPDARRAAGASLCIGVTFMATMAVLMLALPRPLARAYTDEREVVTLAATLIPIAGLFQVFDGTQVVAIGALRGLGDTRAPMLIGLVGFWMIGLPVSVGLGFFTRAGPLGLWWGFVAGLAAVAVLLLLRARAKFRGPLTRTVVDDPAERA
jgi:MATE family multidrug resistance protein